MCNDTATPQLEELVTTVANQLMTVDAATSAEVSQRVLAYLVEQLGPGAIAFTRMPRCASSLAAALVIPTMPALAAE